MNTEQATTPTPITMIEQVKRFDVIKMLERASTRLFHNGSQIHAAELAQAALYLRQDGERLMSPGEHADLCKRAMGDAVGIIADAIAPHMGRWHPTRDTSPQFMASMISDRIAELATLNQKQATTIATYVARGKRRAKVRRNSSKRSRR